jgi:predicted phosphoribosyltransferase
MPTAICRREGSRRAKSQPPVGAPLNPELALGAIAYGGVTVYNDDLLTELGLDEAALEPIRLRERAELERRERAYRGNRPRSAPPKRCVRRGHDGTGAAVARQPRGGRGGGRDILITVPNPRWGPRVTTVRDRNAAPHCRS